MAIVNSLLFDARSGGILSDEEYWLLRRRKSYFGDNLHSLLTPEQADRFGVEAVWGMCGNPSFGFEVVESIRRRIAEVEDEARKAGKHGPPITRLRQIGDIAVEVVRATVRRRVNDKLRFLYGFDADDLVRGSFEAGGRKVEIRQDAVKKNALSILDGSNGAQMIKDIHKNKGVLFGWDREDGALHYHLNAENFVLSMISGRFEAIGTGKYAAGMSFADFLGNQTLARRRAGHGRVEGAFQLILSGIVARSFFHEVGGKLHMAVLDGAGANHAQRLRFVEEERMLLAVEAVQGARKGFVDVAAALEAVDAMVYGDLAVDAAEEALFRSAARPKALDWYLRGYKAFDLPDAAPAEPAPRKPGRKAGRKR